MSRDIPGPQTENSKKSSVWLVIGLGNPGSEYEGTYHNVGFRVVERIAERHRVRIRQHCGPAIISDRIFLDSNQLVLVEPLTYMNLSGQVLPKLFERFDVGVHDVIVVYDDIALPIGRIRLRQKGSSGGHNGIKSIVSSAGTDEFWRVRVGILPDHPVRNLKDFVLSRVSKTDDSDLQASEEAAANAVESLIIDGLDKSMAAYNGLDLRKSSD